MRQSRLPEGGTNLFQAIKEKCRTAEAAGKTLIRLSIGQPTGPALLSAREAAATAVMSEEQAMHEYQDNGSPGVPDFAQRFVQAHLARQVISQDDVGFLPVPGIKPTLRQVIQACGVIAGKQILVATMTDPGYPTPADQCRLLGTSHYALRTDPQNAFRPRVEDIRPETQLVMMNFPHNPSGQIATRDYWDEICSFCDINNIRLWNDAAYIRLSHCEESCPLADIAVSYPELSWAEGFSASKLIQNGTGWRIGAVVGSPDFVADIAKIKGNDDSGFVAPMAAGVLAALDGYDEDIYQCQDTYFRRMQLLIDILSSNGMRLAVKPQAGFFTLWLVPKMAFGVEIRDAEHFNFLMIERTGVVGVHFHPYIRYAVCGDIVKMAPAINTAFKQAGICYE